MVRCVLHIALRIALRIGGTGGHRKPSPDTVFFRRPGFRGNGEPAKAREKRQPTKPPEEIRWLP
jgi:hypothetical protein